MWQYLVWWQIIPAGKPGSLMGFFVGSISGSTRGNPVCPSPQWIPHVSCGQRCAAPPCMRNDWTDDYDYPNVMSYQSHNVLSFRSQNVQSHVVLIPEHPISCHSGQILRLAALSDWSKLSSQLYQTNLYHIDLSSNYYIPHTTSTCIWPNQLFRWSVLIASPKSIDPVEKVNCNY